MWRASPTRWKPGITKRSHDGRTAAEQLQEIRQITVELCKEQQQLYSDRILPALAAEDIHLTSVNDLEDDERAFLRSHFERRVLPVLTPLAVDPGHPFPFIFGLVVEPGRGYVRPGR